MKKLSAFVSVLVLLAMFPMTLMAQQLRTETLKQLLLITGSMDQYINQSPAAMQGFLAMGRQANPSATDAELTSKINAYLKDEFADDFTQIVSPYFRCVSEADGQALLDAFSTPEAQDMLNRMASATVAQQTQIQQSIGAATQQIMMGKTPAPITLDDASSSYRSKFDEYYKLADVDNLVASALNSARQMMPVLPDGQLSPVEVMFDNISRYMKKNTYAITFNMANKTMTEDDLQRYVDLFSTPHGKNMLQATKNMSADALNVGMAISAKLVEHMK